MLCASCPFQDIDLGNVGFKSLLALRYTHAKNRWLRGKLAVHIMFAGMRQSCKGWRGINEHNADHKSFRKRLVKCALGRIILNLSIATLNIALPWLAALERGKLGFERLYA